MKQEVHTKILGWLVSKSQDANKILSGYSDNLEIGHSVEFINAIETVNVTLSRIILSYKRHVLICTPSDNAYQYAAIS